MKSFAFAVVVCLALAGNALAGDVWVDCTPNNVATFPDRVHVRCNPTIGGGVIFFAVSASETAFASRFISMATAGIVSGRTLSVSFDPADKSGAAFGCGVSDCRRAKGLVIR
jgi:hypothetical protein